MQNTHEFVVNNRIKCYCICCVTFGSKHIEQAQLLKDFLSTIPRANFMFIFYVIFILGFTCIC